MNGEDLQGETAPGRDRERFGGIGPLAMAWVMHVSHELRGPLNVILGMSELLHDTSLTPRQRELVGAIRTSGEQLISTINEMADFVGMATDEREPAVCELSPRTLVEDIADRVGSLARTRGIELVILVDQDVPEWVRGNPTRLRRVLTTLTGAAVRLATGDEIILRVEEAAEAPGGRLRFSIEYAGPPVWPGGDGQEGKPSPPAWDPASLHLAMAGRLVDRMGGVLKVDTLDGGRSRVSFDAAFLPVVGEKAITTDPDVKLDGLTVLVVDDSAASRRLLAEILEGWGCRTVVAADGKEALQHLEEAGDADAFDLAILDFVMPDMDGMILASAIRAHRGAGSMPLILLTSAPTEGDGERAREIGFDAYLTKPINREDLLDAVRWVVAHPGAGGAGLVTIHSLRETRRSRLRILLVDDDELNRKTIAAMLERLGYRCDLASDGEAAVRALARREYDVVLMDYEMPVMDGFEATRRIREREGTTRRRTPIVATTADALAGNLETLRMIGMDEYLPKPIDIQELAEVLSRLAGGKGSAMSSQDAGGRDGGDAIDLSRLDAITGGDPAFLREIVSMFKTESRGRLLALQEAVKRGEAAAVHAEAHALKGAAANLGALRVSDVAAQLQRAGEAENFQRCGDLLITLEAQLDAAEQWLTAHVDGLGSGRE